MQSQARYITTTTTITSLPQSHPYSKYSNRLARFMTQKDSMSTTTASPATPTVVRVGVGVLVQDPQYPNKVVCGIRKGSHGAGTLSLPGGHLELYESWEDCAKREVLEECGLELEESTLEFGHVTNDPMPLEHKHYVTIFILAKCRTTSPPQIAKTMEPDKCEGWYPYSWDELQQEREQGKLFGPLDRLVGESPPKILQFLGVSTTE